MERITTESNIYDPKVIKSEVLIILENITKGFIQGPFIVTMNPVDVLLLRTFQRDRTNQIFRKRKGNIVLDNKG